MLPTRENWLARAKRYEPAKLVRNIKALLAVLSLLGYVGLTQAQITFLGTQLEVILPLVGTLLWPVVEWISARWLRSKVASPATAQTLATAVLEARNLDAKPPIKALEAAERVLKP